MNCEYNFFQFFSHFSKIRGNILLLRNAIYNKHGRLPEFSIVIRLFMEQTYDTITINNKKHRDIVSLYVFVGLFCLDG